MIERIAAFGLDRARPELLEHIEGKPLDDDMWAALTARVRMERIEGLLAATVDGGALPVTDPQLEEVREAARSRAAVDLHLEGELLAVGRILSDAGVAYRVLKGLAWAHSVYPDPSWRGTGDVDLLIATGDWYRAIEILEANGLHRTLPELRPGFDASFGKDATLATPRGWEVDLHRVLVVGPFGLWSDIDELFVGDATISVGGFELPVLDPEPAFVHACYNAALADDPPRLIALRDVAQMALSDQVDPVATERLARRWKGEQVAALALTLAGTILGADLSATPLAATLGSRRPTLRDRVVLASYHGPARGFTSQAAGVLAVPGTRRKAEYLSALARPQRSYLSARGWSTGSLRQGLRRMRGLH